MRINIYVDARFGPQELPQSMISTALGANMRINIYVDARLYGPKASQELLWGNFGV